MREQTRYSLSGAISLVAHAAFVLAFVLAFEIRDRLPELDEPEELEELTYDIDFIEFEAKDEPDLAQGEVDPEEPDEPEEPEEPAEEEAAPPPTPLPEEPEPEKAAPEPEPEAEPKPRFGAKRSKIKALVPPKSTWTLVLANKRIRKLPFRESATEIMAPLRDFRLLVDDAGFNIWEDFDFVVMGSPDATDQTQAFVAVQYASFDHQEMRAGIERGAERQGMVVDWRQEEDAWVGDPRYSDPELEAKNPDDREIVLLPGKQIAVYVRKAHVDEVVFGPDESKGKTKANFVANVARMRRYTNAEPKAGIQVVVEDIRRMVRVPAGAQMPFEIPNRAELMWEAAKQPELVIKLEFLASEDAEKAEAYWNDKLEADLKKLGAWQMAGGIVSATKVERDERTLILRHQFNEVAARVVLELIAKEFGKAMRYSKEEALANKQRREANWEARNDGKLLPSEALEGDEEGEEDEGKEAAAEGVEPAEDPKHAPKPNAPAPEQPEPKPESPDEDPSPEPSPGDDAESDKPDTPAPEQPEQDGSAEPAEGSP